MKVENMLAFVLILSFIVIILILYFLQYTYYNQNNTLKHAIQTLYRQCSRWAIAADQDENEIIRVLHANYAAGYLWAIKDIAPTDIFKRATGEEFLAFEKKIVAIQDEATMRLAKKCKEVIPTSDPALLNAIYGK